MRYRIFGKKIIRHDVSFSEHAVREDAMLMFVLTTWVVSYCCHSKPPQAGTINTCWLSRSFWRWQVQVEYGWAVCSGFHKAEITLSGPSLPRSFRLLADFSFLVTEPVFLLAGSSVPRCHSQGLALWPLYKGRRISLLYNPHLSHF